MNNNIKTYPWVFWITFSKRNWFKKIWWSRGSNFLDIQFYKIRISIGMPWHKEVLSKINENSIAGIESCRKTNESFTKWYHFHIGSY